MVSPTLLPILTAVLVGVLIALALAVVWLVRKLLKLKHDYEDLAEIVHGLNNDVRDFYGATLAIDERLSIADEQINGLADRIANLQQHDATNHPYSMAIQKVRNGASINELMQTSGLSQDEAALLIRLHGSKAR
jgi:hypothetical protein